MINEEFQVGGTDIYLHKYLGPVDPLSGESSPAVPINAGNSIPELGIQDLIFMENRDRHYDKDVYIIRGIYDMQDIDFNLSQFGMFLQNDTIFINFHLRSHFDAIGRKIMPGDVVELPHQKDEYALDDSLVALKRFYVVQDVSRPARGYSPTWYPHLVRAKCVPLVDSQEFSEILNADSGAGDGSTLRDLISTYKRSIEINDQIIAQAEIDAPLSGYDTANLFVTPAIAPGLVNIADASGTGTNASSTVDGASTILTTPDTNVVGYLTGDGLPPNNIPFGSGISFPSSPSPGQFYLRVDYLPNRLFRYDGAHWVFYEDKVRMTLDPFGQQDVASGPFAGKAIQQTLKSSFINNTNTATIAGKVVQERQALSKALRPRADN